MARARWLLALCCAWLALGGAAPLAQAAASGFTRMQFLLSDAPAPPAPDAGWTDTTLPDTVAPGSPHDGPGAAWYRGSFTLPGRPEAVGAWAVYIPYLYEGGQVWLNGVRVGEIPESTPAYRVIWERPHLVMLPAPQLRAGSNEVAVRTASAPLRIRRSFPRIEVGPLVQLQPAFDQRMFWVRTVPQVTVVVCLLAAGVGLFIYWRRRKEVLYGLFGLAAALWGVRALTYVVEVMPVQDWLPWRLAYHVATGGLAVVMAIFALRFAGLRRPRLERALLGYWAAGPLWLLAGGRAVEGLVNRFWTVGLIPIGCAVLAILVWAAVRQRTPAAVLLSIALLLAVAAAVHDYLVAWNAPSIHALLPAWAGQRIFLLHHAANALLLVMGGLLTARFVRVLSSLETMNRTLEELNQTLESRVAERERRLAANFERMAALQRQNAASQERQLIMREIHDGLGSRLFTSLSRLERGDMDERSIADALRACIADMRLALDALAPDDDFQVALGNFLFRWQAQLREARVQPTWSIDVPDAALAMAPQAALQLLRIAQEALTNVLKHARARHVRVELRQRDRLLELEVADDGVGADPSRAHAGHGIGNMRARAHKLHGRLELLSGPGGTRVVLQLPLVARAPPEDAGAQHAPGDAQAIPGQAVGAGTPLV